MCHTDMTQMCVCVCVCVVSVIVKHPVLPSCVVDRCSRNPLLLLLSIKNKKFQCSVFHWNYCHHDIYVVYYC